jgi:two-component system, NarL family, response regulator LiaR
MQFDYEKDTISMKKKPLSEREDTILHLVAKGHVNKEIADELCISVDTVKKHLQNIYRKLGATNKIKALQKTGRL